MKRRSLLVLVTLLVSLFVVVPTGPVSACELNAGGECAASPTVDEAILLHTAAAPNLALSPSSPWIGRRICTTPEEVFSLCYQQQFSGMWTIEELQGDDTWLIMGSVAHPPAFMTP